MGPRDSGASRDSGVRVKYIAPAFLVAVANWGLVLLCACTVNRDIHGHPMSWWWPISDGAMATFCIARVVWLLAKARIVVR